MKFSTLYEELKFSDVFTAASPEEVTKRKKEFRLIRAKEAFENVAKTKLPDGSWHIHNDLHIDGCDLTSLKPFNISIVDGIFDCADNLLTDLEGCPKKVGKIFVCSYNALTNLIGAPKEVGEKFLCYSNNITSLEGCPIGEEINGEFACSANELVNLNGAPKIVKGHFRCDKNRLTTLKGGPEYVGGVFECERNQLESLDGLPKFIGDNLFTGHNKRSFTDEEVRKICDLGGYLYI